MRLWQQDHRKRLIEKAAALALKMKQERIVAGGGKAKEVEEDNRDEEDEEGKKKGGTSAQDRTDRFIAYSRVCSQEWKKVPILQREQYIVRAQEINSGAADVNTKQKYAFHSFSEIHMMSHQVLDSEMTTSTVTSPPVRETSREQRTRSFLFLGVELTLREG